MLHINTFFSRKSIDMNTYAFKKLPQKNKQLKELGDKQINQ